jgi:hypothetical protein
MTEETSAPGGDSAPAADVAIPTHVAGGDGPLSVRDAMRSVTDWRRKEAAQTNQQAESAPAATPAQESGEEPGAAPQETEATGETQEVDPAAVPPLDLPRSWTKDQAEHWSKLDRATQEFLIEHDRKASAEVRRSQNEAAEARKAIEAEQAAVAKARQEYETALPALLQTMQQTQAGEFADIRTLQDVERLAAEDWPRYVRWDASQKKIAAVQQEMTQAQERQQQELTKHWETFSQEQDKLFAERVPDIADPEKATKLRESAVGALRDLGFTDQELQAGWNGQRGVSLRDHRLQLLILDAVKYREAKASASKPQPKPLPQVQRPGAAPDKGAAREAEVQTLTKQLDNASGMNALRAAAKLVAAKRATAR